MRARSDAPGPGGAVLVRVPVASHSRFARDTSGGGGCCFLACCSSLLIALVSPQPSFVGDDVSCSHRHTAAAQPGGEQVWARACWRWMRAVVVGWVLKNGTRAVTGSNRDRSWVRDSIVPAVPVCSAA